jgi:RNA-binding protein
MLTSKQRAMLRSKANRMDTILQIGKGGITQTVIQQVEEALLPREMIKLRVLESSMLTAREAAVQLAEETGADVVQVIGTRFVLFKRNPKEPVYDLD